MNNAILNFTPITLRSATRTDHLWLEKFMKEVWGGLPLVIRTKSYNPLELPGIIAENKGNVAGFLYFEISNQTLEIIVFEVFEKFKGIGTIMMNHLKEIAKDQGCTRIYLMTTNDNLDALRFYQTRGFHICGIHVDSVKKSRDIKPTIGRVGDYGILVRDEIDLEYLI